MSSEQIALNGLLIGDKKESAIADNRAAEGAAELVALELVFCCRVPRSGVEDRVAQEFKSIAVEVVAARLCDDVHDTPGILTVLRAVVACLHTEFLERIRHGEGLVYVGVLIDVITTVELVANLVLARTVGDDCHRAGKRLGLPLISSARNRQHRARDQQRQVRSIAAV